MVPAIVKLCKASYTCPLLFKLVPTALFCALRGQRFRSKVSGDHDREAELLKNHINDLDQLTKVKADNEDMRKKQDDLRCAQPD